MSALIQGGSLERRLLNAGFGSPGYVEILHTDAIRKARSGRKEGNLAARSRWLSIARRHSRLLRLMTENETWERENGKPRP